MLHRCDSLSLPTPCFNCQFRLLQTNFRITPEHSSPTMSRGNSPPTVSAHHASDSSSAPQLLLPSSIAVAPHSTAQLNHQSLSQSPVQLSPVLLPSTSSPTNPAHNISPRRASVHSAPERLHESNVQEITHGYRATPSSQDRRRSRSASPSNRCQNFKHRSRSTCRSPVTAHPCGSTLERTPSRVKQRCPSDNSLPCPSKRSAVGHTSDPCVVASPIAHSPEHVYNVFNINVNSHGCTQSFS